MAITNIQIIAGSELVSLVSTIREILRDENKIGAKSIITNGYVLNSAVRYLNDIGIDFKDISYWERINQYDISPMLGNAPDSSAETMKFRLAALSDEKILAVLDIMSETLGTRIRKNYVVKLFLKSYLYEKSK